MSLRTAIQGSAAVQTELALDENKHARAWREFKAENPKVYAILRSKALERLVRRRRFGIGQLFEVVRWEVATTWDEDESGFKVNNNFRAYCARDLIAEIPELAELIEIRQTRTA
jgi:hypothetical protein